MYNLFMFEMSRDYFCSLNVNIENINDSVLGLALKEKTTDMKYIRNNGFDGKEIKWALLDYPISSEVKEINIPKHLHSQVLQGMMLSRFNIKLIPTLMDGNPPIIKDLKSMLNYRTVLNEIKLSHLIHKFNRINVDRCLNLKSMV